MVSFSELKKNVKKEYSSFLKSSLVILGDCATQHIATAIRGYAYEEQLDIHVCDTDYNQILTQIMDETSELYQSNAQNVLIVMCTEKLYEQYCKTPGEKRSEFALDKISEIENYHSILNSHIGVNILQANFPMLDECVFGNFSSKVADSFTFQLRKLNVMLAELAQKEKNCFIVDFDGVQSKMGRDAFYSDKLYYIAKMPFTNEALVQISKQTVDIIGALNGRIKKCVIADLDNTLWGGVVGDDGLEGIELGELGRGKAFCDLQRYLLELKKRGIILCICSKNNEDAAKEPFEKHPDMILHLDDISLFVANWQDKASNIRYIQQTLNIGMDSIVFLDDNPFERGVVRSLIQDITVVDLPEDPASYVSYVRGLNLFETTSFSEDDKNRTTQYQAEMARVSLQESFDSYSDYLEGLEMQAYAKPFDSYHFPRIAQLTQRSNQFNLRTIRYTPAQIETLAEDDHYITLYFTLKDKFGDHGLISVVIMEKRDDSTLFLDTWLMSCRVLKRTMEEFIVNKIISTAKENGFNTVIGEYIKTKKNAMVENIYAEKGFTPQGDVFMADVGTFKMNETYIKEIM